MKKDTYTLVDSGHQKKLERVGPYLLVRPAAQALWAPSLKTWPKEDAEFTRGREGDGKWRFKNQDPAMRSGFLISMEGLKLELRLTDFGHIGIFPEHHSNAGLKSAVEAFISKHQRAPQILNLFAYTGVLSLLCAEWGGAVVHLDASRTSVAWARTNAQHSGLESKPVRWIVDDVKKFLAKELRRESQYDFIILDPPSYGRGNKGEVWKIEDDLLELLGVLAQLRSKDFAFLQLSAHSPGLSPLALENMLGGMGWQPDAFSFSNFEMHVKEEANGRLFPSGIAARAVVK